MSLPTLARHLYAALSPRGRGNCLDANDACDLATAIAKAAPEGPDYTIYLTQAGTPGACEQLLHRQLDPEHRIHHSEHAGHDRARARAGQPPDPRR